MALLTLGFPHAGGGAHAFRPVATAFRDLDVCGLDYPGRGRRVREPLLVSLDAISRDAYRRHDAARTGRPYALFGHSMGARVALLFARQAEQEGARGPELVVVSASAAPGHGDDRAPVHTLPDEELLDALGRWGGLPESVGADPLIRELFLPILRADLEAAETWRPDGPWRINAPLVVVHARDDVVDERHARAWAERTTSVCSFAQLEGGHFCLYDHPDAAARAIEPLVRRILRARA